jgi:hypothetical protein
VPDRDVATVQSIMTKYNGLRDTHTDTVVVDRTVETTVTPVRPSQTL